MKALSSKTDVPALPMPLALLRACVRVREFNIFAVLILVGVLISLFSPYFLTTNNLMGVFRSFSLTAIMAVGMMLVIITGGIDLSVGSVMGLSSLVTALSFQHGLGAMVAVAAGLATGVVVGAFNGFLVTRVQLPPFIATDRWRAERRDERR